MRPAIFRRKLRKLLKDNARIAVLGIGSDLRADDSAGLLALKNIRQLLGNNQDQARAAAAAGGVRMAAVRLFNGGTAPENLTGAIRRFNPAVLVMIDAVDLGKKAGAIGLVDLRRAAGVFLTHKLPVKLMLDFLRAEMKFTSVFIGIQPKSLAFGAPVADEVARAARRVGAALYAVISASGRGRSFRAGRKKSGKPRPRAARSG